MIYLTPSSQIHFLRYGISSTTLSHLPDESLPDNCLVRLSASPTWSHADRLPDHIPDAQKIQNHWFWPFISQRSAQGTS